MSAEVTPLGLDALGGSPAAPGLTLLGVGEGAAVCIGDVCAVPEPAGADAAE